MPTDFSSFKKIEGAAAPGRPRDALGRFSVIVKLRKGAARPSYVKPRAEFGADMFTAEVDAAVIPRLNDDPAVASISLSKSLNKID